MTTLSKDEAEQVGNIPEHVALVCEAYDFAQFSNVEQLNQLPVSVFNALHKVLEDLYRRTYTQPQPAAQEQTSAVPVVEQLVEALDGLFSGDVVVWSLGGSARPRAAITAGQQYLKENGK